MSRAFAIVLSLSVLLGAMPVAETQQQPPPPAMQAVIAKSAEFSKLYREKNYAAALKALDEMIDLGRQANSAEAVAGAFYNQACIYALTGQSDAAVGAARQAVAAGYTNYFQFAGDADFSSIRRHPGFVAFMNEVRERFGPKVLEWNPGRTAPAFAITVDRESEPPLVAMRAEFDLDRVVAGAGKDDYTRLRALTAWTSKQWQHSPTNMASKPDPVTILREARAGGRFICRDYAIVVAGVVSAFGLPARVLNLLPKDVERRSEAHSVAEVWISRLRKWVLADGQYGTIGEVDGVPLNGVELQAAIARDDSRVTCSVGAEKCAEWKIFIVSNMFYFKFGQDQRRFGGGKGPQLVLVPTGAPDPHKFAGGNEEVFAGAIYVSDPKLFYAPPR